MKTEADRFARVDQASGLISLGSPPSTGNDISARYCPALHAEAAALWASRARMCRRSFPVAIAPGTLPHGRGMRSRVQGLCANHIRHVSSTWGRDDFDGGKSYSTATRYVPQTVSPRTIGRAAGMPFSVPYPGDLGRSFGGTVLSNEWG